MSNVFKIQFESAFPATGPLQTKIVGWLSDSVVDQTPNRTAYRSKQPVLKVRTRSEVSA